MEPVIFGDSTLYLGNCLDILPKLDKNNAIVTDPPYGISHKMNRITSGSRGLHHRRNIDFISGDDRTFEPTSLLKFKEVIMWGANHYCQKLPDGTWLAWDKLCGHQPWDSFSDVEFAWMKGKSKDRIFSFLWKGICKDERAEEKIKRREGHVENYHPTQKPEALMTWCIKLTKSETVIDPYLGSGTTGVSCIKLGRKFIGIEIESKYFDIACKRIEKAYKEYSEPRSNQEDRTGFFF